MSAPDRTAVEAGIADALRVFHAPGDVFEVRIPKTRRKVVAGYFNDPGRAARAILAAAEEYRASVYHSINELPSALLARAANRLEPYAELLTKDHEVVRRRILPIDCDPVRLAGIPASDEEHAKGVARLKTVVGWLTTEHGWPAPILADSGNGAHGDYRIDLPNDDDARQLLERVLKALAARFDDGAVKIDCSMFNASRVLKCYGTVSRKGDHTTDRPHRRAQILDVPDPLLIVTREQLAAVAGVVESSSRVGSSSSPSSPTPAGEDVSHPLLAAFSAREWYVAELSPGKHAVRCPWADTHSGHSGVSETVVYVEAGTARWFKCQHATCLSRGLRDVYAALGLACQQAATSPSRVVLTRLSTVAPEQIDWIWKGRYARGKATIIAGDPGIGKSQMVLDSVARISRGGAWPDGGVAPLGDVIILAAEDGVADTIRPRVDALLGDPSRVHILEGVFDASQAVRMIDLARDLAVLEAAIREVRPVLVVIDPITAYLGKTDSYKDGEVRGVLAPLLGVIAEYRSGLVWVAHLAKDAQRAALHRPGGSIGFVAAARLAFAVGADPHDPKRRVLAPLKSNISAFATSLAFRIPAGVIEWEIDPVPELDAATILAPPDANRGRKEEQAKAFLHALLAEGPVESTRVFAAAEANGITDATLRRAQKALGVDPKRSRFGGEGGWYWALPTKGDQPRPPVPEVIIFEPRDHLRHSKDDQPLFKDSLGNAKDDQKAGRGGRRVVGDDFERF